MLHPTKSETERIYKDVERAEKERQAIKRLGEQLMKGFNE